MLSTIVFVVIAIVIVIVLIASSRPNTFRIERSISINAEPEKIFQFVNDFHNWKLWSPWEKMDPSMNRQYSGSESGIGSIYEWNGNKKVGQGRMEILESVAAKKVFISLQFIKPFVATNTVEFSFQSTEGLTHVVWAMEGKHQFLAKIMCVFMNMDKMAGKDFENGLQNLQRVVSE